MTPTAFFDFLMPRRMARAATAFALGFTVSQSQFAELGTQMYEIRERGVLRCGIDTGLQGFARQTRRATGAGSRSTCAGPMPRRFLAAQSVTGWFPYHPGAA